MSYTAEQLQDMYCEGFDDQDGQDFKVLSCSVPGQSLVIEKVQRNLTAQVRELRRRYGSKAEILLYKER